ncbi:TIGR00725 family protein [Halalkalibaculum sp. DA3122]|uniref:TIGR00725 family protein n=1 Tax=unclassified Halalkalibaculum TaxID=2964617 RepID=UPI003754EDD2
MAKTIIGVMGPGDAPPEVLDAATQLGQLIAAEGWVLLTGGRRAGVMDAASRGAKEGGGLTVGVLPTGDRSGMSPSIDIPIATGIGSARNNVNVLTSDVVIACGVGMGTISEVLLAAKAGRNVILLNQSEASATFLKRFDSPCFHFASTPGDAVSRARELLR